MKVSIVKGNLVIEIPLQKAMPSASGKTLVVASTRGSVRTGVQVGGKFVTIGLNAYIPVAGEVVSAEPAERFQPASV